MKFVKSILLICCSFLVTTAFAQTKTLPDVAVKTLKGEPINMQDFGKNGKITVVSFWATWCAPCKKELDAIAEVYEDWPVSYTHLTLPTIYSV